MCYVIKRTVEGEIDQYIKFGVVNEHGAEMDIVPLSIYATRFKDRRYAERALEYMEKHGWSNHNQMYSICKLSEEVMSVIEEFDSLKRAPLGDAIFYLL